MTPLRILYDHQAISLQVYGGISRYFYQLIKEWEQCQDLTFNIGLRFTNNTYFKDSKLWKTNPFFENIDFKGKMRLMELFNRLISVNSIKRHVDYDLLHITYYHPYFIKYIQQKPFVVTVYDTIHELFPDLYPDTERIRKWKGEVMTKASRIISISHNTKKDIMRLYGIPSDKIQVIYLANSLDPMVEINKSIKLPELYLLFVGVRKGYKNFNYFIESASSLMRKYKKLHIICVGGGLFDNEEQTLLKQLNIFDRTIQMSVSDNVLSTLYKHAAAFVFPSAYEGFGIPVLEAFACHCPVVLSFSSSFPEVAGEAGVYFKLDNQESLYTEMEKMITDYSHRKRCIENGLKQLSYFSWKETAKQTLLLYKNILTH